MFKISNIILEAAYHFFSQNFWFIMNSYSFLSHGLNSGRCVLTISEIFARKVKVC